MKHSRPLIIVNLIAVITIIALAFLDACNSSNNNEIVKKQMLTDDTYQNAVRENLEKCDEMESVNHHIADNARKKAKELEKNQLLQWLQGTWEWSGMLHIYGSQYKRVSYRLTIDGDYITSYGDGDILAQGKIKDIDMEEEIIHFGNDSYLAFNKESEKLYTGKRSEGTCFHKVSNSVSKSGYGTCSSSKSNNSEYQLMNKFNKLNEEAEQLIDEIYKYYSTGQAGPWTIQAVYRLKQIQEEKISLAQRMGDRELEAICRQQKTQTLAALRQIGF